MSDSFEKIHVKDDRIGCISSKIKYGVLTGGQAITAQSFKAISETPSNQTFNIAVPSLETVISREIMWGSTVTIAITTTGKPLPEMPVNYGVTDALAAFPLSRAVNNITININNNSVSMNYADILEPLLRLIDPEELAKYESTTPTTLDYLANYRDGVQPYTYMVGNRINTTAAGDLGNSAIQLSPDGAETLEVPPTAGPPANPGSNALRVQSYHSYPNNVLAYDLNRPSGSSYNHRPRGSFKILAIYASDDGGKNPRATGITANDATVYVTFRTVEPIFISPFVFGCEENKAGMYGIQNIAMQINMLSNCNRTWRSVSTVPTYTKTASIVKVTDSTLYMEFLTPKASDMLESRNVVPFYQMPVFKSNNYQAIEGRPDGITTAGTFPINRSVPITSNSIQLSVVPDKLLIFVRRVETNLNCCDTSSFLTITKCQINWNNQAGLLSTMTPEQLYKASLASGLHNLTYDEFTGLTVSIAGDTQVINGQAYSQSRGPLPLVGAGANPSYGTAGTANYYPFNPGFKYIPTTGTILCLSYADVIPIQEQYYAPGSIGQFNLQVTLDVVNNHSKQWDGGSYELCIIPIMSGAWINERGTSSSFIGLLTKQDVLETLEQEHYTQGQVRRLIGGSFMDRLKSGMSWLSSKLSPIKHVLEHIPHEYAQKGAKVLDALGYSKYGHSNKLENRLQ